MASFTIRVVLHGANAQHYADLHAGMAFIGGRRTIIGDNRIVYDLPDGEYEMTTTAPIENVLAATKEVAAKIKAQPRPSVFITQAAARMWSLEPVPGQY